VRQHGLTFTELLVSLSITAILATLAVPAFSEQLSLLKLTRVLDNAALQLRRAQNLAIASSTNVTVSHAGGNNWCLVIALNACDCKVAGGCKAVGGIPPVNIRTHADVTLEKSTYKAATHPTFSASSGGVSGQAGSLTFSINNLSGKVIVSNQGRIRVCLLQRRFGGYAKC